MIRNGAFRITRQQDHKNICRSKRDYSRTRRQTLHSYQSTRTRGVSDTHIRMLFSSKNQLL